jgi:hypothetical protein
MRSREFACPIKNVKGRAIWVTLSNDATVAEAILALQQKQPTDPIFFQGFEDGWVDRAILMHAGRALKPTDFVHPAYLAEGSVTVAIIPSKRGAGAGAGAGAGVGAGAVAAPEFRLTEIRGPEQLARVVPRELVGQDTRNGQTPATVAGVLKIVDKVLSDRVVYYQDHPLTGADLEDKKITDVFASGLLSVHYGAHLPSMGGVRKKTATRKPKSPVSKPRTPIRKPRTPVRKTKSPVRKTKTPVRKTKTPVKTKSLGRKKPLAKTHRRRH